VKYAAQSIAKRAKRALRRIVTMLRFGRLAAEGNDS